MNLRKFCGMLREVEYGSYSRTYMLAGEMPSVRDDVLNLLYYKFNYYFTTWYEDRNKKFVALKRSYFLDDIKDNPCGVFYPTNRGDNFIVIHWVDGCLSEDESKAFIDEMLHQDRARCFVVVNPPMFLEDYYKDNITRATGTWINCRPFSTLDTTSKYIQSRLERSGVFLDNNVLAELVDIPFDHLHEIFKALPYVHKGDLSVRVLDMYDLLRSSFELRVLHELFLYGKVRVLQKDNLHEMSSSKFYGLLVWFLGMFIRMRQVEGKPNERAGKMGIQLYKLKYLETLNKLDFTRLIRLFYLTCLYSVWKNYPYSYLLILYHW